MRNTRTTLLVLLLLAVTLGASACDSNGTPGKVFSGGTNGLLFSFEQDTPPDLIYDNGQTPFSVIVKAQNDGEFDTKDVQWRITGINRNDFPQLTLSDVYDETIIGRTKLQDQEIEGEEAYITVADEVCYERSLRGGGELDYTLNMNMCYAYATIGTSTVCVQENYLDGENEACDPDTSSQISVSGAPVTISGFRQQTIGRDKLRLQYDIELKDNVNIWAPTVGGEQNCKADNRAERVNEGNWVYVRLDSNGLTGSQGSIDCVNLQQGRSNFDGNRVFSSAYTQEYLTGNSIIVQDIGMDDEGYIKLGSDNTATLTCTLTLGQGMTDSLGTVDVGISYYVEDSISRTMTVTHTDGSGGSACSGGTVEFCDRAENWNDPSCR